MSYFDQPRTFLERVAAQRLAEQMEAAGKPIPAYHCAKCLKKINSRRASKGTCWSCREKDWKAAQAGQMRTAEAR